jgi:hypothetical protein
MTLTNLGEHEWQSGWRLAAVPTLQGVLNLSRDLIALAGMTPDGPPDVRHYPTGDGKGGEGVQVYQPLVESWLVISTWPAHGFTRIHLSSCKYFDHERVSEFVRRIGGVLMDYRQEL